MSIFIDFSKTFHSIRYSKIYQILMAYRIPEKDIMKTVKGIMMHTGCCSFTLMTTLNTFRSMMVGCKETVLLSVYLSLYFIML